jgi:hypothetical protein
MRPRRLSNLASPADDPTPAPVPGPPARPVTPLVPLDIPPADWRAEEEHAAREAAAAAQAELEPEQPSYPAKPQKRKTSTPRLDEVRSWGSP